MTCDKGCMPDWWVHSMHLSHLRRKNTTKCHILKTGIQQRNIWDSSEAETFWLFSLLKFPLLLSLMPLKCICLHEICVNASVGAIQSPQRLRWLFFLIVCLVLSLHLHGFWGHHCLSWSHFHYIISFFLVNNFQSTLWMLTWGRRHFWFLDFKICPFKLSWMFLLFSVTSSAGLLVVVCLECFLWRISPTSENHLISQINYVCIDDFRHFVVAAYK